MRSILFTGYYGNKNLGDDIFGLISVWASDKYWKKKSLLYSKNGPYSKIINIDKAINSTSKYWLVNILWEILVLLKYRYLVFSGGSILHSKVSFLSRKGIIFLLLRFRLLKIGAIGVSLGPFKSDVDYKYIESLLRKFSFLALRDKVSYDMAVGMNLPYEVVLSSDLAFLLPNIVSFKKEEDINKVIGVSICHYERYTSGDLFNEMRRENAIKETLTILKSNKNIFFRFFIISGNEINGDKDVTFHLIKELKLDDSQYEVIPYENDVLLTYNSISTCDVMFSTRLHGSILAATANVPSVLIEYHRKCSDFLSDIGIDSNWKIGDFDKSPKEVADLISVLIEQYINNFYPNREKLIKLSLNNFNTNFVKKFYE